MILSDSSFFTKSHYEKNTGYAPPYLCELVVHCLELLSFLSYKGLKFRFKGGNSLLLILDKPLRFSIDIDIASTESREKIKQVMNEIKEESSIFTKLTHRQPKTKPWLPLISFKIYFNSVYKRSNYVMLDVVLEEPPYEGQRVPIEVGNLYRSPYYVEVAIPEGLMGDKLLTLGPSTLGIPIGKNKEAQRLKHVFDISRLSDTGPDLEKVRKSLLGCLSQENKIQRTNFSLKEVVEDTVLFCSKPLKYEEPPALHSVKEDAYLYEIVKGFPEFKKHLFGVDYTWDMLRRDMAKIKDISEYFLDRA